MIRAHKFIEPPRGPKFRVGSCVREHERKREGRRYEGNQIVRKWEQPHISAKQGYVGHRPALCFATEAHRQEQRQLVTGSGVLIAVLPGDDRLERRNTPALSTERLNLRQPEHRQETHLD